MTTTTTSWRRRLTALATPVLLLGSTLAAVGATTVPATAAETETPASCSQQGAITKTLENGTSWAMCWNMDSRKGLVLESIQVKAPGDTGWRRVLDSLALAQLNVPYDSGEHQWNDITSYGFGNQYLQKLSEAECPDGELLDVEQAWMQRSGTTSAYVTRTIPAICVQEVETGLSYRSHEQDWGSVDDDLLFTDQGTEMVISTVSKVDWYEYQAEYRFSDTGTITPRLGATGDISPEDFADPVFGWSVGSGDTDAATSHHHNAFWRVDFGIDAATKQEVQQIDSEVTGTGARGPILSSTATPVTRAVNLAAKNRRVYHVSNPDSLNADQHPRGYQIEFLANNTYEGNRETEPEVTFLQYNACQEFASQNQNPACALQDVIDYVDNSTATITNPVAFVNVGFHHLVRDEDQSPMPIHWQGFLLTPRDFWAQNPLTPAARDCVNGNPGGQVDSTDACGHATATTMTLSGETQQVGTASPVTATVAVSQLSGDGEVPAGTVSIVSGADLVATGVPLVGGTASVALPAALKAGQHSLVAVFAPGDGTDWLTSSSAASAFTVTQPTAAPGTTAPTAPAATATKASLAKKKVTTAQRAKVTVTVTGATTGAVSAKVGGQVVSGTLSGGRVTLTLPRLKKGTYRVKVSFAGTTTAAASTASPVTLKVVGK
jgi:hypothetical protein